MKKTVLVLMAAVSLFMTACNNDVNGVSNAHKDNATRPHIGAVIESGEDGSGKLPAYAAVSEDMKKAALAALGDSCDIISEDAVNGIIVKNYDFGEGKAHVFAVDLNKCGIKAFTPYDMYPDTTLQTIGGQMEVAKTKGAKVIAAIAANYTDKGTGIPQGTVIQNGKVTYQNSKGDDGSVFLGLYKEGGAFVCNYKDYCKIYRNKVSEAVCGNGIIVKDGKVQTMSGSINEERTNRSGAGVSADRNTLYLVYGESISLVDLSNILISSGCSMGVNLGYGTDLAVINDQKVYGTDSKVGPTLLVTEK